ncbi:hypothetical protein ACFQH8_18100 [Halomicroarcula sp. GCM10025710]
MAWLITALLLASVLAVPLASGQQSDASSEWTLSDLQKQGEVTDTRYPSLRVAGEMEAFWLVRYPPRGTGTYGDQNSKKYIKPTTTVQRNKVRLYASFPFDSQNRTFSLTKVYWHPDSRQVQTDNGTVVTKRYANVTAVGTQNVTFQSGMRRHSEVLLRGHYDDAERVTMLLSLPDGNTLRWTFKHKSIPTAKAAPDISSRGDLNEYILLWVVLPTLLLSFISYKKVPKFRREALAGTGRGAGTWIAMGFVVAIGAYLLGYYALASLTAHFPVVFSLFIAYVVAVMQLEDDEDAVETWGFIRIDPETATSPLDDKSEVLDSGDIEIEGYDVVFDENNEPVLYSRGLLSMWARYKGCYARLNIDNKEAEWNCVGDYDKVIVVDQDAPALVEHLPPESSSRGRGEPTSHPATTTANSSRTTSTGEVPRPTGVDRRPAVRSTRGHGRRASDGRLRLDGLRRGVAVGPTHVPPVRAHVRRADRGESPVVGRTRAGAQGLGHRMVHGPERPPVRHDRPAAGETHREREQAIRRRRLAS